MDRYLPGQRNGACQDSQAAAVERLECGDQTRALVSKAHHVEDCKKTHELRVIRGHSSAPHLTAYI